jgi:hypothetical protein
MDMQDRSRQRCTKDAGKVVAAGKPDENNPQRRTTMQPKKTLS